MRALAPTAEAASVRERVAIHWEAFGDGPTTVVLLPTWSIVPSRVWQLQVATLARRHRVVTFDGRGSGASAPGSPATAWACGRGC